MVTIKKNGDVDTTKVLECSSNMVTIKNIVENTVWGDIYVFIQYGYYKEKRSNCFWENCYVFIQYGYYKGKNIAF